MKHRSISKISQEELERLPTKRLLARLERLRQCEESALFSDYNYDSEPGDIVFKDSPQWRAAYEQLEAILPLREHVVKGRELVVARKRKAKLARTFDRRITRRT